VGNDAEPKGEQPAQWNQHDSGGQGSEAVGQQYHRRGTVTGSIIDGDSLRDRAWARRRLRSSDGVLQFRDKLVRSA
jgi:hypothetical protein